MRLILQREGAAESGLKRYNGGGVYNLIGRKSHFSGQKKDTKVSSGTWVVYSGSWHQLIIHKIINNQLIS